jgi:hypothetical protein
VVFDRTVVIRVAMGKSRDVSPTRVASSRVASARDYDPGCPFPFAWAEAAGLIDDMPNYSKMLSVLNYKYWLL